MVRRLVVLLLLHDAGPLPAPGNAPLANGLLDYSVAQVLRAPPTRRERYRRADAGA